MAAPRTYLGRFLDWLIKPVLDFAGRQLANEALSHGSYGDVPFVPDDLKVSRFHARSNDTGRQ